MSPLPISKILEVSEGAHKEKVEETGSQSPLVDQLVDHQKAIELSLAEAISEAAKAGQWDVVEMLAKTMRARQNGV